MMNGIEKKCFLFERGAALPLSSAQQPICSDAVQYGAGLFESVRVYSSVIPFLDGHIQRAMSSAEKIGIKMNLTPEEITLAVYRTIGEQGIENGILKVLFPLQDDLLEIDRFAVVCTKEIPFSETLYERGARIMILDLKKSSASRLAGVQSFNCLENLLAQHEARQKGFDDAVFLNERGNISEGPFSNIFFIKGKVMYIPSLSQGIRQGIIRGKIIKIAGKAGYKIFEGKVGVSRIKAVDEAFLTSTLAEIVPVVEIGRTRIGKGVPGEKTKKLHALYRRELDEEISRIRSLLRS